MTLFWIFAAALIALALALVLPPLLRCAPPSQAQPHHKTDARRANLAILREQLKELDAELTSGRISADQHALARTDIERRVLDEEGLTDSLSPAANSPVATNAKRSAIFVAVCIPLLALGLYGFIGNPQALLARADAPAPESEVTMAQVEALVTQMAQKLESQPADQPPNPQAWEMLARSYAALQRFPEAARAYEKAAKLAPNNAQLLADHADVLAMLQGQSTAGEPEKLIARALTLDPKNLKALALAGSAAFERKDFAGAIQFWSQARQLAPPTGEFTTGLDRSLQAAREAAANQPNIASSSPKGASAPSAGLSGTVSLSPSLASKVKPDDTIFIFARATQGPRMPLAILKRKASELPITFKLDDSTAMSDDLKLSKFTNVVVAARVSASGNVMPQTGDLLGQLGPVSAGTQNLKIVIDSVQP
jgi:cytochrome c-type biogenesis protein CcmH